MRVWLELARISNLPTVWTNVLAGWLLAGGRWDWWSLGWLLAGGSLLYTGGMFLNDAADAKWDRENRSERPIAKGRVSARAVWAAALIFLVGGLAMVLVGGANLWVALGLVAAIVGYDLYHKPWKGSVVIMGLCRVLLYLTAGSAVVGGWEWAGNSELILKALALGGYVVGLSLVARGEANGARDTFFERVLGVVMMGLPLVVAGGLLFNDWPIWVLAAVWVVMTGVIEASESDRWKNRSEEDLQFLKDKESKKKREFPWWLLVAVGISLLGSSMGSNGYGLGFVGWSLQFLFAAVFFDVIKLALRWMRTPPKANIGRAVGLLLAGIPLVDALALGPVNPWLALGFVASVPLLRLWQRKIAAT